MTNARSAFVLLSCAAMLTGCMTNPNSDGDTVANSVRKEATDIVAAYNSHDAHATAAFDAPDYVGIFHGQPNTAGPAADEAGMKAQMASADLQWTLGESNVTVSKAGDMAVFEAPYTFVVTEPGGASTREKGTWIAIFKRGTDGKMKLWRSLGSDGPESAPGA